MSIIGYKKFFFVERAFKKKSETMFNKLRHSNALHHLSSATRSASTGLVKKCVKSITLHTSAPYALCIVNHERERNSPGMDAEHKNPINTKYGHVRAPRPLADGGDDDGTIELFAKNCYVFGDLRSNFNIVKDI